MDNFFPITSFQLDKDSNIPLHQQISNKLRELILSNSITPGTKIPSHRDLAELLGVSRNTIVTAIEQLISEGYLISKVGAGSFVSQELPEDYLQFSAVENGKTIEYIENEGLTKRGLALIKDFNPTSNIPNIGPHNLFRKGLPDMMSFPFRIWEKISRKYLFYENKKIFGFQLDLAGYLPLRQALAGFLIATRAVKCDENQLMIVTATEEIVYLTAKLLTQPGDKILVEEPGFLGAKRAFKAAENEIIPIPFDSQGFDIGNAMKIAPDAKLVFVSPSHQFPTGCTLSLKRRMELLTWAEKNNGWIIEDDCDSVFQYNQRPLPALQGLDNHGRVIYCGSFNLILFPGIRLDYTIVPKNLFNAFVAARNVLDIHLSTQNQLIITDFITEGHLARHIRKMRKLYKQRRDAIIKAFEDCSTDLLTIGMANSGVHICVFLDSRINDEVVFREAAEIGIEVLPLSRFYYGDKKKTGLVLGFAACDEKDIQWGVKKLMEIIEKQI